MPCQTKLVKKQKQNSFLHPDVHHQTSIYLNDINYKKILLQFISIHIYDDTTKSICKNKTSFLIKCTLRLYTKLQIIKKGAVFYRLLPSIYPTSQWHLAL